MNYAARGVYGEASGSRSAGSEVAEERYAVASVMYNRINNPEFRKGSLSTFRQVLNDPGQFRGVTVAGENAKFLASDPTLAAKLNQEECADLNGSIAAVRKTMDTGPGYDYTYFRGGRVGRGTRIGGSWFW